MNSARSRQPKCQEMGKWLVRIRFYCRMGSRARELALTHKTRHFFCFNNTYLRWIIVHNFVVHNFCFVFVSIHIRFVSFCLGIVLFRFAYWRVHIGFQHIPPKSIFCLCFFFVSSFSGRISADWPVCELWRGEREDKGTNRKEAHTK